MSQLVTANKNVATIQAMMSKMEGQIRAALPKHMTPDRMLRIALTELRRVPGLALCEPMSFLGAIVQCAQLGLEPGSGLGHAYLIPFRNTKAGITECQLITGYRGLIELARRSGQVDSISSRIVWPEDVFEYAYGTSEYIKHIPAKLEGDAKEFTHAYAVAKLKGSDFPQFDVMTVAELKRHAERYGKKNPVWQTDFREMARKTVVRRLAKYLPQSPELVRAQVIEDAAQTDDGQANWLVIDPDYQPKPNEIDASVSAELRSSAAGMGTPAPGDIALLDKARLDFDLACEEAEARGVTVSSVVDTKDVPQWDAGKLRTAAEIMRAAKGGA